VIARAAAILALAFLQLNVMTAPPKPKSYIVLASDQVTVPANKKTTAELRFQVVDGFHVNSHTPRSELLIPTNLKLIPAEGLKAGPPEYPRGTDYAFSFEPGEKLDVYTGAFTVKLPVEATPGEHTLEGTLHYQACDQAACYPPKSLPIKLLVVGK
jgi:hypothetical protein